ncbi:hypothetical protein [Burkholderia sp. USMB20]|uniref:COG4648 family protein n=1 Tax=Burkholderia sp. USMB20 TaxID=1571773 RepID=UPI001F2259A6|nr:hypothetical protein [Burkholderia sp. USMB20]
MPPLLLRAFGRGTCARRGAPGSSGGALAARRACVGPCASRFARHFEWGLYLEHASFNLAMALLFGRTLAAGQVPLCTRFATLIHGTITPAVARYTRHITLAWTLFFVAIAAVSTLLFATAPIVAWSTFANYLSLPLVAVMFAAEHACRRFALPHDARPRMVDAVRAYRASTQPSR